MIESILFQLLRASVFLALGFPVVWLLIRFGRLRSAVGQRVAWGTLLAVSLLCMTVPLRIPVSVEPVDIIATESVSIENAGLSMPFERQKFSERDYNRDVPVFVQAAELPAENREISATESAKTFGKPSRSMILTGIFGLWLVGLLVVWGRRAIAWFSLQKILRDAVISDEVRWSALLHQYDLSDEKIPLRLTDSAGPALVRNSRLGLTLIVPETLWEELSPELRDGVLRHELGHYRHGDTLLSPFLYVLASLQWFNPFAWLVLKKYDEATEWHADQFAYGDRETGSSELAETFLAIHRSTESLGLYLNSFSRFSTLDRVNRLLPGGGKEHFMKKLVLGIVLVLLLCGGLFRIQLVAEQKTALEEASADIVHEIDTKIIDSAESAYADAKKDIGDVFAAGSLEQQIRLFRATSDLVGTLLEQGEIEKAAQRLPELEKYADHFKNEAKNSDDPETKHLPLTLISDLHFLFARLGMTEKAVEWAKLSPETEQYNASEYLVRVARIVAHKEGFAKAEPILDEALIEANKLPDPYWRERGVRETAECYEEAGQSKKAEEFVAALSTKGQVLGTMDLISIRRKKGQTVDIPEQLARCEKLTETIESRDERNSLLTGIAAQYALNGDLAKGKKTLEKAEWKDQKERETGHDELFRQYAYYSVEQGEFKEAEAVLDEVVDPSTKADILMNILRRLPKTETGEFKRLVEKAEPFVVVTKPDAHRLHNLLQLSAYKIMLDDEAEGRAMRNKLLAGPYIEGLDRNDSVYRAVVGLARAGLYDEAKELIETELPPENRAGSYSSLELIYLDQENPEEYDKRVKHWRIPIPEAASQENVSDQTLMLTALNPDGKPASGVDVEVRMSPQPAEWTSKPERFVEKRRYGVLLKTDENGTVPITLSKQPPNRLECFVRIDGAVPFYAGWGRGGAEPVPSTYTIRLDKAAAVGVRFVNEKGEPVKDVVIHPSVEYKKRDEDLGQFAMGGRFRSDSDGNWVFRSAPIPPGSLGVEIQHPDYMSLRKSLPLAEFTVGGNGKPVKTLVLDTGFTVTGNVVDENDKPIAGAAIRATFGNSRIETTSDETGRYHLTRCQPQRFRLFAAAKNHAPEVQVLEFIEAGPKEKTGVNFKLAPGGMIRVRVTEKNGKPIPNTRIFFQTWRDRHSSQTEQFGIGLWYSTFNDKTDENGVWTWNEAPPDGIRADICAPGKMQLGREHLVPRQEEYVFVPPPELVVTGKVTDAETEKPIAKMTLVPAWFSEGQYDTGPHWLDGERYESADGKYRFTTDTSRFAHGFKIEAEGFLPFESRPIKGDEEAITIDVALRKGKDVATTVVDADNRPVAGANVLLGIPGSQIDIWNGMVGPSTFCDRRKTDKDGRFEFPPQKGRYELIVVHPAGVAWAFCESNAPPKTISLEKWARIEGTLKIGDPNDRDSRFVETRETRRKSIMETDDIDEYRNRANIDVNNSMTVLADGKFTFDKVLPGAVSVGRRIVISKTRNSYAAMWSHSKRLNLKPGETKTVVLGDSGRTVTGKLLVPAESGITPDWNFAMVLFSPARRDPRMLKPPQEILDIIPENIRNEKDKDKSRELWKAWSETDEGKKYQKALQGFYIQAERAMAVEDRHRPDVGGLVCPVASDGTFRMEAVPPGPWNLFVTLEQSRESLSESKTLARLNREIEIPDGNDPFELGNLVLEPTGGR